MCGGWGGEFVVTDCGYCKLALGLMTALVETWWLLTHMCHLPVEESTVALQKVQVF